MRKLTVVGRDKMVVFDDMELERKVTIYEKWPEKRAQTFGEWQTRTGDILSPKIPTDEPLRLELSHFLRLVARAATAGRARDGLASCACSSCSTRSPVPAEIHETAIVYPGTVLGEGVKVLEDAVIGKQPTLSPRRPRSASRSRPHEIGDGTVVSTGAVVFAGSTIGADSILGDQSCVRERVTIGDDVVLGRGSLIENDTTVGAMTKIQAGAYITAYSTLEEHVFIAPCVVTSNDNFMGRTERRHELIGARRSGAAPASAPAPCSARRRDRRGGVRRRRRRRDEGRRAADARRRQTRARAARREPGRACSNGG